MAASGSMDASVVSSVAISSGSLPPDGKMFAAFAEAAVRVAQGSDGRPFLFMGPLCGSPGPVGDFVDVAVDGTTDASSVLANGRNGATAGGSRASRRALSSTKQSIARHSRANASDHPSASEKVDTPEDDPLGDEAVLVPEDDGFFSPVPEAASTEHAPAPESSPTIDEDGIGERTRAVIAMFADDFASSDQPTTSQPTNASSDASASASDRIPIANIYGKTGTKRSHPSTTNSIPDPSRHVGPNGEVAVSRLGKVARTDG